MDTVVLVTHNGVHAGKTDRQLRIRNGLLDRTQVPQVLEMSDYLRQTPLICALEYLLSLQACSPRANGCDLAPVKTR